MRRLFSLWSVALGLVAILAAAPWELHGKRAAWAEVRDPCGVAVIIGNGDYEHRHVPDVTYVHREAEAFKGYVLTVLGFDPVNFIDLRDGRRRELYNALGTRSDPSGSLLWSCLHGEGGSDVLVFYSVHGVPGQGDGRGYVLPVDADPKSAEDDEYSMDLLYENLGRLAARSVTFLDTCFSGGTNDGGLIGSASPVYVKASCRRRLWMRCTAGGMRGGRRTWSGSGRRGSWRKGSVCGLGESFVIVESVLRWWWYPRGSI